MKIYCVDALDAAGGSGRHFTFFLSRAAADREANELACCEDTFRVSVCCLEVPSDKQGMIQWLNKFFEDVVG